MRDENHVPKDFLEIAGDDQKHIRATKSDVRTRTITRTRTVNPQRKWEGIVRNIEVRRYSSKSIMMPPALATWMDWHL